MAFDEKKEYTPKQGLKNMGGQKSMFDNKPAQPTQQEFQHQVQESQDKLAGYKKRVAELVLQFNKTLADKTLPQNRNIFNNEAEKEMLQNMIQLAMEINNNPDEQEGMGSLAWITLLFNTVLRQRDRANELEFSIVQLQKRLDSPVLVDFINKEITKALDKKKSGD
jgi:hypothetical protein